MKVPNDATAHVLTPTKNRALVARLANRPTRKAFLASVLGCAVAPKPSRAAQKRTFPVTFTGAPESGVIMHTQDARAVLIAPPVNAATDATDVIRFCGSPETGLQAHIKDGSVVTIAPPARLEDKPIAEVR